jgi:beta-glucuronidase
MRDLVERDKNRACVVMWSVANEAGTDEPDSRAYFQEVISETRRLDGSRPVTNILCTDVEKEQTADLCDVVCVNRYHGWYWHPGRREMIRPSMISELSRWHARFGKPVIVTEFGADTIEGLHLQPAAIFSEEWQIDYLRENCAAFDHLDFVTGEHVWNFADFQTKQGLTRVNGNRKGVFTRARQPKAAAHFLRDRWLNPGDNPLTRKSAGKPVNS